jgi:two-component system, chemotaxis family, response regulator Rcp1
MSCRISRPYLPRKDGLAVLVEFKADLNLHRILVIVLASSQAEEDVARSYDLQAGAYVVKPVDFDGIGKIVPAIEGFWFSVVCFPCEADHG